MLVSTCCDGFVPVSVDDTSRLSFRLDGVESRAYVLEYQGTWTIGPGELDRVWSSGTRAVLAVTPNNPTGSYVQAGEFGPLNAFCRDLDLALIVDEVFLDYGLDDQPHSSFAGNQEVLTFTLSGLSKISALPQMKVAWVVTSGPKPQAANQRPRCSMKRLNCGLPVASAMLQ